MTSSITVHEFPPVIDMQPSPFGLKLETWLRMAGYDFNVNWTVSDLGPKGKVPFATIDGAKLGDSELIIGHLAQKSGSTTEEGLNSDQLARGTMIRRLIEENLYFIMVYSRWVDEKGWAMFKEPFFASAPAMIRGFIARKVQKKVVASLMAQGIARHTPKEIYQKGADDIKALSILLGDQPYFLGDKPTLTDASAYGLLANLWYAPVRGALYEELAKYKNLIRFTEQMKKTYWPTSKRGGGDQPSYQKLSTPQKAA
jgi:glutathione S-transferase